VKRRFRRSKFKKSEKMMRKDVSGGQRSKIQKIRFLLNALKNEENKGNNAMF
jgi:hypothetical protein